MKYIKKFEKISLETFFRKLETFFNEIKLKNHKTKTYKNPYTVQIYYNEFGIFTVEDQIMFYENNGEELYPSLNSYIASKIPGSDDKYLNLYDKQNNPNYVMFSKEEYELFKYTNKFNI